MFAILMTSAKLVALSFLKIKVVWNKNYDVMMFVYDVIKKIFHVTQMREVEVIIISALLGFGQKNCCFEECSVVQVQ